MNSLFASIEGFAVLGKVEADVAESGVMPAVESTAMGAFISDVAAPIGLAILLLGMAGCCYRIFKGPHLADRVLAGDTLAFLVVGMVVVFTMILENDLFFDAALVVAIIGFASTVAFSQYIGAKRKFAPDPMTPGKPDPGVSASHLTAEPEALDPVMKAEPDDPPTQDATR